MERTPCGCASSELGPPTLAANPRRATARSDVLDAPRRVSTLAHACQARLLTVDRLVTLDHPGVAQGPTPLACATCSFDASAVRNASSPGRFWRMLACLCRQSVCGYPVREP